ncbi:uncharacterized protein SPSK_09534 [Sporothrix schenckii 1099-18]|uniref:Ketoreductase domain-containing protein n=1 Tax=Sporothrix schenckii 1099-18 TaxID=1397361 RepID=A0A0F2M6L6_SPOSC|nr:uncharacterized protein SPSK_09534 [Sporothrix schenckii 1099-18]KJR85262.1 hypothetical protein SPSK_09534 [Sporothrix schenckii 1099-18]
MAQTTYLITGANKGIGRAMVQQLLQRANTSVIACVRQPNDPTGASLKEIAVAESNRLVLVQLRDPADYAALPQTLAAQAVARIDVVIANAGHSTGLDKSLLETTVDDVVYDCTVNAAGPLRLFAATWPLQEVSAAETPAATRFILISSTLGSLGVQDQESMPVGVSYGMSKAAANWFAKKLSIDFKDKGLVTYMGQALADALGIKEPPITADESAQLCLEQIDDWTPEKNGKFLTYTGKELPW